MVYDGAVADLNSSQEKKQVYFDATVLEVKKKSIKVKCSESFDSGIPVDEEFSVTTNRVESGELPDLNAGDHIRIVFDGIIKESYEVRSLKGSCRSLSFFYVPNQYILWP